MKIKGVTDFSDPYSKVKQVETPTSSSYTHYEGEHHQFVPTKVIAPGVVERPLVQPRPSQSSTYKDAPSGHKNKKETQNRLPNNWMVSEGSSDDQRINDGTKKNIYIEGMKKSSYGGMKTSTQMRIKNTGYGGTTSSLKGQKGVKASVGWENLKQMSNSLPDLNKAITVMSFIAFSVFVANLGINAIANVRKNNPNNKFCNSRYVN